MIPMRKSQSRRWFELMRKKECVPVRVRILNGMKTNT
jgi:hypothetical protein